jgi:hypothetical protein
VCPALSPNAGDGAPSLALMQTGDSELEVVPSLQKGESTDVFLGAWPMSRFISAHRGPLALQAPLAGLRSAECFNFINKSRFTVGAGGSSCVHALFGVPSLEAGALTR